MTATGTRPQAIPQCADQPTLRHRPGRTQVGQFEAATTGDEGGTAWHDRMDDLWEAFRVAVDRVHRDGRLADRWTVRAATDWVWARSHLTTWQHLVGERGWAPDHYTEHAIRSILAEVVTPAPDGP